MSKDWYSDIKHFHIGIKQIPDPYIPHIVPPEVVRLRMNLIKEETTELYNAITDGDLDKIADGIVDSIVVLLGTSVAYGIDIKPVWDEIHRTNMAKLNDATFRSDGKLLKPNNWIPPDIVSIIKAQRGED